MTLSYLKSLNHSILISLLNKGRNQEAIKVLKLVCKWNKKPLSSLDHLNVEDTKNVAKKGTFKGKFVLYFQLILSLNLSFQQSAKFEKFKIGYLIFSKGRIFLGLWLLVVKSVFRLISADFVKQFEKFSFHQKTPET